MSNRNNHQISKHSCLFPKNIQRTHREHTENTQRTHREMAKAEILSNTASGSFRIIKQAARLTKKKTNLLYGVRV